MTYWNENKCKNCGNTYAYTTEETDGLCDECKKKIEEFIKKEALKKLSNNKTLEERVTRLEEMMYNHLEKHSKSNDPFFPILDS